MNGYAAQQMSLFEMAKAKTNGPATSQFAAEYVNSTGIAKGHDNTVLGILRRFGQLNAKEIELHTKGINSVQATRALSRLCDADKVELTGTSRKTGTRKYQVWRIKES